MCDRQHVAADRRLAVAKMTGSRETRSKNMNYDKSQHDDDCYLLPARPAQVHAGDTRGVECENRGKQLNAGRTSFHPIPFRGCDFSAKVLLSRTPELRTLCNTR